MSRDDIIANELHEALRMLDENNPADARAWICSALAILASPAAALPSQGDAR